jgi:Thiopurine S-methyltransferase (TPMT)
LHETPGQPTLRNRLKGKSQDSTQPDFWSERYASGITPWQLNRLPRQFEAFISRLDSPRKILIPGCGDDSRTIEAFQRAGHQVFAIDFSPVAVEGARKSLGESGDNIILGNFFSHKFKPTSFDIVYERTFLCSLPPWIWKDYAKRVAQLLRPAGMLAGFFFYGQEIDPPPYPLTKPMAARIFEIRFTLKKDEPASDSLPIFSGKERWQEWQLRS